MKIKSLVLSCCLSALLVALTTTPAPALVLDSWIIQSVAGQKTPDDVMKQLPPAIKGEMALVSSRSGYTKSQLIELGRFLFNYETFKGNGRTCATCHPPHNNFTIDPQYIATLPDKNPLFVAEFNPALKDLENPQLMRSLGLICENVDGFDKPCVFRGVPHTLALRTSTTPPQQAGPPGPKPNVIVPGTNVVLANSTGWSADGAPIDPTGITDARGQLRLFALGAIVQHFPKTIGPSGRVPGKDFRLPSDLELDALLEFQLSLGRQEELDLSELKFKNPIVEFGKQRFQDPLTGKCLICHNMGGATAAGPVPPVPDFIAFKNVIANTGVEHIDNPPAYLINSNIPVDGGFGKPPATVKRCVGGANNDLVCSANDNCPGGVCIALGFGDGTFDAPVVIEAAATPPYFHNNSVPTLEAAVGFYCSPEFQERLGFAPPDGINFAAPLNLKTDLATSIAAFLRAAGSMELIDRGMGNCQEAISGNSIKGKYYINIAMANARDAIKVLKEGVYLLYPEAQEELDGAYSYLSRAMNTAFLAQRDKLLRDAKAKLAKAKGMICQ